MEGIDETNMSGPVKLTVKAYETGIPGLLNNKKIEVLETYKVTDFKKVDHAKISAGLQRQNHYSSLLTKQLATETIGKNMEKLERLEIDPQFKCVLRTCLAIGQQALSLHEHLEIEKLRSMILSVEMQQSMMEDWEKMKREPVTMETIREQIPKVSKTRRNGAESSETAAKRVKSDEGGKPAAAAAAKEAAAEAGSGAAAAAASGSGAAKSASAGPAAADASGPGAAIAPGPAAAAAAAAAKPAAAAAAKPAAAAAGPVAEAAKPAVAAAGPVAEAASEPVAAAAKPAGRGLPIIQRSERDFDAD